MSCRQKKSGRREDIKSEKYIRVEEQLTDGIDFSAAGGKVVGEKVSDHSL